MLAVNSSLRMSKHISAIIKGQRQVDILKACEGGGRHLCGDFFFWEACAPCSKTHGDLHRLRQLKVILLLLLPNHRKGDFPVDEKRTPISPYPMGRKGGSTI